MDRRIEKEVEDPSRHSSLALHVGMFLDIVKDAVRNFGANGDTNLAAAIAFYFILSIVPLLMLTILAAGFVFGGNPQIVDDIVQLIQRFHPYFRGEMLRFLDEIQRNMKLLGTLSSLLLFWSSSLIFDSAQTALRIAFRSERKRNYFLSKALAIAMIPLGWVMMILILGSTSVGALLSRRPFIIDELGWLYSPSVTIVFSFLIPFSIMTLFVTLVYKIVPTAPVTWGNALAGGTLFSCLSAVSMQLFTWYISNFSRYRLVYGSLETFLIFVLWIFYVGLIFLFCAELVSSYQRRDLLLLERIFLSKGRKR
ncbi:MAG: YihY/virulence factor BrkB family protein [Deltaproteobacteria bacterium]|nr:YihY/virulence factor BrkB family protein [Deltaproteobacteria bacterium]